MCNEKENEIRFIKGDVLEVYFVVDDIELEYISRVVFSCVAGKILCDLPYSEEQEAFCLRFNSQMSDAIQPGFYTYDLTLELAGGSRITLLHNEDFVVLKKKNTLNEEAYIEDEGNDGDGGDDEGDGGDNNEPEEPVTPPGDGGDEGNNSDAPKEPDDGSEEGSNDGY